MSFKVDFVKVLKTLAQSSLDEKWYNVPLIWEAMQTNCPFCYLAEMNTEGGRVMRCDVCVLRQFINLKIIDICKYIGRPNIHSEKKCKEVKYNVIYWLEQIAEHGTIINKKRDIFGSGSLSEQYEFNKVKKND